MGMLTAGLGFKPDHLAQAIGAQRAGLWFEVHAENYMTDGGPRPRVLEAVAAAHPLSLHGVSMSLAGPQPLDAEHLSRFAALTRRVRPVLVSEHLAWSRLGTRYEPDLLPFVRDAQSLQCISDHVQQVQDAIGQTLALENPSHYVDLTDHKWDEIDFLIELVRRSGCKLLVDVANVHVSAHNLAFDASTWLDRIPGEAVAEVHLAGHSVDPAIGDALWIDSHSAPVHAGTWELYRRLITRIGPRPTLIEWDCQLPNFDQLLAQAKHAHQLLALESP